MEDLGAHYLLNKDEYTMLDCFFTHTYYWALIFHFVHRADDTRRNNLHFLHRTVTHTADKSEHCMTYCVLVKALFCREVHEVLAHTQVPLAHNGGAVAYSLQGLCYGGLIQWETCTSGERQRVSYISCS